MSLSRKFIISFLLSIFFIITINILSFYVFYTTYLKIYFTEKIESKDSITLDYIDTILDKQTIDDIDSIFSDTEIEFFELLQDNNGIIPLTQEENVDVVINYLVKSGVSPKYIEELVPTDNFSKVIDAIKLEGTPEYNFISRLSKSIIAANILGFLIIVICLMFFVRKTILPIRKVSDNIKKLKIGNDFKEIEYYNSKDEIGLLIGSINTLNKKLNLQETIRSRLLADISHELKTPITSIQCYLEGISDGVIKLDQKNLNAITNEMIRLIDLVNRIMDYEKIEREKFLLNKECINVTELMKVVVETHKKRLKENKQRIKISGDDDFSLQIDKNLFIQLLHNIIGNFLKYAGKNSLLKVNLTKKYIDFTDNGIGIKSSEVPFLTEKFYQGDIDKSGDMNVRGIGVGLSITRKIIDAHGWRFEIKSEINKGFSFKIYI